MPAFLMHHCEPNSFIMYPSLIPNEHGNDFLRMLQSSANSIVGLREMIERELLFMTQLRSIIGKFEPLNCEEASKICASVRESSSLFTKMHWN